MRRCVVPLLSTKRGFKPFDVIIYGKSARELQSVPNPIISSLARRYPDHYSSPFIIYDLETEYG